jgi:HEAT repeat protein
MRAVLVGALVVVTSASALAADKPEPKYEGKPLEYWVSRFQKAENDKDRADAVEALKVFGPDAVRALPAFIEMLDDRSPGYRRQVLQIIAAIGPKAKGARSAIVRLIKDGKDPQYTVAIEAIVAISSDPKEAVPVLIPLLEDANADFYAYCALCEMGPAAKEALPTIRRYVLKELAAMEKEKRTTFYRAYDLTKFGGDAVPLLVEMLDACGGCGRADALDGLEKLGPRATAATPALLKLLKHDDPVACLRAALILWKLEKHPAVVTACAELLSAVPDIMYNPDGIRSGGESVAVHAATFLGDIGPDARAALPQLREAVAVSWTLWLLTCNCEPPGFPINTAAAENAWRQWRNAQDRIRVGVFAERAIAKIEAKPKK